MADFCESASALGDEYRRPLTHTPDVLMAERMNILFLILLFVFFLMLFSLSIAKTEKTATEPIDRQSSLAINTALHLLCVH